MMTKEEQRIAIAEWLGFAFHNTKDGANTPDYFKSKEGKVLFPYELPDYPEDLNAMHEAVSKLSQDQKNIWSAILWRLLCDQGQGHEPAGNAPADLKCEALCRILWPERWKE